MAGRAQAGEAAKGAAAAGATAGWFEAEAPLGPAARARFRRLLARGMASWPLWVGIAVVVSGVRALVGAGAPSLYQVTVVMRVSEGQLASSEGTQLGVGALRAYVNDLAFTGPRLIDLMKRYPASFKKLAVDPAFAVATFRDEMEIEIAENDFVEDRGPLDPPRTARLAVTFQFNDPEVTWKVAQELAQLVVGSTLAGQKAALESELAGATAARAEAEANLVRIGTGAAAPPGHRAEAARARLQTAQRREAAAMLSLNALRDSQLLRFEVVDRGDLPRRPDPVTAGVRLFVGTLVIAVPALWMIAGAVDPRVLGAVDLAALGIPVLGQVSAPGAAKRRRRPAQ